MTREGKLTKAQQMARVRRTDTAPELALRRALWRQGLRYRLRLPLPGSPDIAFVGARVAVFVDGCFWHGCPQHYTAPVMNAEFWMRKLEANRSRDKWVDSQLRQLGWRPLRLWEHTIKTDLDAAALLIVEELQAGGGDGGN